MFSFLTGVGQRLRRTHFCTGRQTTGACEKPVRAACGDAHAGMGGIKKVFFSNVIKRMERGGMKNARFAAFFTARVPLISRALA